MVLSAKTPGKKGEASDNLSGLYVGSRFAYNYDRSVIRFIVPVDPQRGVFSSWDNSAGILTGYQQRLFHKLYFDGTIKYSGASLQRRFLKVNCEELKAKAGIGFAF
nr:hypothetical protein [uncultured Dyadobacter sp.]